MEVELELIHFEKYVKRADLKAPKWFVLENDITTHPDFFEMTGNEFTAFIHIAAICSKVNSNVVRINTQHAAHLLRITTEEVLSSIQKLEGKRFRVRDLYGSVRIPDKNVRVDKIKLEEIKLKETRRKESKVNKNNTSSEVEKKINSEIWESYKDAYSRRYGVDPIRNASVNAQVSQLRKRIGADAVTLVKFYLTHNDGFYLKRTHSLGLCLKDCESLMTQMQRGVAITATKVREFEKHQVYDELRKSIQEQGI